MLDISIDALSVFFSCSSLGELLIDISTAASWIPEDNAWMNLLLRSDDASSLSRPVGSQGCMGGWTDGGKEGGMEGGTDTGRQR